MEHINIVYADAGNQHSAAISSNKELYIWGTEWFGEFLIPHLVKSIKGRWSQVSLGKNFGSALTEKGEVYVWGNNNCGQLALGDNNARATPWKILSLKNKIIMSISCGHAFVVALGETIQTKKFISGIKGKHCFFNKLSV